MGDKKPSSPEASIGDKSHAARAADAATTVQVNPELLLLRNPLTSAAGTGKHAECRYLPRAWPTA